MSEYIDMGPKHKSGGVNADEDGKFHYFTSSGIGWAKEDNLLACIEKQKSHDHDKGKKYWVKSFNLFAVPGPDTFIYPITMYQPDTEGVTYIGSIDY